MKLKKSHLFLIAAEIFVVASPIHAATVNKASTGTDITDPASWGGTAPGVNDTAAWIATSNAGAFTLGATGATSVDYDAISFTGNIGGANGAITIGSLTDTGTITFSSTTTSLQNSSSNAVTVNNAIICTGNASVVTAPAVPATRALLLAVAGSGNLTVTNNVSSLGSGAANDGSVHIRGSGTGVGTVSGNINVDGPLTKTDTSTWVLSGTNTVAYTIHQNGTLLVGNNSALGSGTVYVANTTNVSTMSLGSALAASSTSILANNFVITGAANTFNLGAGTGNLTLNGAISQSGVIGTVTKSGATTVTLTGANTYTGATTVNAGRLQVTGSLTSAITVGSAGTLLGGGTTTGALTLSGGSTIFGAAGTLSGNNGSSFTASAITSSAGAIKVLGTVAVDGTVDIARYTGVSGWTGTAANFDLSAFRGAGAVTSVPDATTGNKLQFTTSGKQADTWTQASGIWDHAHAAGLWSNASDNLYYTGDDVLFSDIIGQPTATVTVGTLVTPSSVVFNNTTATAFALGGAGDIAGTIGLTKNGTGTVTLGTANSFTGQTNLNAGTLVLAHTNSLQNSTLNGAGGTLVFDSSVTSNAFILGCLTGSQGVALQNNAGSPAAIALTIGGNQASTTYSGILSGSGSLTKIGAGMLTLSGTSTYTGKTFLSSGVTRISADSNLGTAPGAPVADQLTFSGGMLQFGAPLTLAANRGVKLGTASTFDTNGNAVTEDAVVSGAGTLIKSGAGTLTLTKSNTHSGGTTVNAGTLQVGNGNATNGKATLNGGNLTITSGITYGVDRGLTFASNTNATVSAASGTASLQGFDIQQSDIIVNTGVTASIDASVGLKTNTYGIVIDNAGDISVSGVVSGNGSDTGINMTGQYTGTDRGALYKFGTGTLTLTGASTFTAAGVPVASVQNGTLKLSGGNDRLPAASGVYLGQGTTSGKLVLDGISQTLTGLKNVGTGTTNAVVGGNTTLSTLTVNNTNAYTFAGAIGGAGANENNLALVKSGSGALTLSGTNTYTGDTTVNEGTLSLSSAYLADSSKVNLGASGAVLALNYVGSDTVNQLFIGGAQQALGTWGSSASPATHIDDVHFSGTGMLTVTAGPANSYDAWATVRGLTVANNAKDQDPDGDGWNNLKEFAFDGDPLSGASGGKTLVRIATVGVDRVLVLTLPVRSSATFPPAGNVGELVSSVTDGITYHIQAGVDLAIFPVNVDQVTAPNIGTLHDNLPALSSGWSYRSFFVPGSDPAMNAKVFIRAVVAE